MDDHQIRDYFESDYRILTLREDAARHVNSPEISGPAYFEHREKELASSVAGKVAIYLDQRYWIFCRDASLGRASRSIHSEIFDTLKNAVAKGKAFCPLSIEIFSETGKQFDKEKRAATCKVVDELSCNIRIQNRATRRNRELDQVLDAYAASVTGAVVPPIFSDAASVIKPWTFPAFTIGYPAANRIPGDTSEMLCIQKAMFDSFSRLRFRDLIETFDFNKLNMDDSIPMASLNDPSMTGNKKLTRDMHIQRSRSRQIKAERNALNKYYLNDESGRFFIFLESFLQNPHFELMIPSIDVPARLDAGIRFLGRQYKKKGDSFDHAHATAALPYCEMFLTERLLCTLITDGQVKLDKRYSCVVAWRENEIVDTLKRVLA